MRILVQEPPQPLIFEGALTNASLVGYIAHDSSGKQLMMIWKVDDNLNNNYRALNLTQIGLSVRLEATSVPEAVRELRRMFNGTIKTFYVFDSLAEVYATALSPHALNV